MTVKHLWKCMLGEIRHIILNIDRSYAVEK